MPGRRELDFRGFDEVKADVARLLAGHACVGNWSLAEILRHLAEAMRLTVEGPPAPEGPTREQDVLRRRFLSYARFPDGVAAPAVLGSPEGGDAGAAAEEFSRRVDAFVTHEGPFASHPRLGPLSREEWVRFHLMHCAHHLGFADPC